jgi:NitT/TauT family transport system ATP-binding protein
MSADDDKKPLSTNPPGTGTGPAGGAPVKQTPPARDPLAEAAALAAMEAELLGTDAVPTPSIRPKAQPAAEAPAKPADVKPAEAKISGGAPVSKELGKPLVKPPVVQFEKVTKRYGNFTAIKDVTFSIPDYPGRGEFVSILGPSGCGKSTVIRMIAGLLPQFPQTEGKVLIDGKPIFGPGPDRGMVFQDYTSFDNRSVLENVAFGLECRGVSKSERHDLARLWISKVGLSVKNDADKYPHQLSGGMRQRVAIARTLILEPRIILMDEPFGALDPPTRSRMQDNLVKLWREQSPTIFFITHSIEEAVYLGDHILLFSNSPGTVLNEIRVPPPERPSIEMQRDPKFIDVVMGIRETIDRLESSNRAGD